ncbi:MAG TPA: small basic family protein [Syntrophomonadaceae bacterium]|nr:small basic family protein [Syntrophomonadaceae bacterium]
MWLPLLGLLLGIAIGSALYIPIPGAFAKYLSVAVLASLDSVFGGLKSILEDNFDGTILLTGFFTNALLAALLAYLGDRLGVDLYLAAVFAFGVRLFQNLAIIRREFLAGWLKKRYLAAAREDKNGQC